MSHRTDILLICGDRAEDLRRSLPRALAQPGSRVTVIDNASRDGSAEIAAAAGAEVLRLPRRLSWCAANNAAVAATAAPEVLLLNADCFLAPDFLERARPRLAEPGVGAVAPKLLRAGPAGEPLPEIDTAGMGLDRRRKNSLIGHGEPAARYSTPGSCFGADGAAALLRRELLRDCEIDGRPLDEALGKYAADVDLAWRAQLRGWSCAYEPRAVAHHIRSYSPSTRARVPEPDRRQQFRNRYLMIVHNETRAGLARDLPRILAYEVLALGHVLLRERHLLGAYAEAWRLLAQTRHRRRVIQARRRVALPPFGLEPPA